MFHPSYIKDELYELTDNYCCGSNIYRREVCDAIKEFFDNKYPHIESDWYDYSVDECGMFFVAWIEVNHLHTEAFEWRL